MKIVWIGFHVEGVPAFTALAEQNVGLRAAITLDAAARAKRSGAFDYAPLCRQYGIPLYEVGSINSARARSLLEQLAPDVCFVLGWSQIIAPEILAIPRLGMIGAHASLLPHNRGSAPVNWAIIRGETETGNSLMWLAPGVDQGAVIDQMAFPITPFDTCETIYGKVAETNRVMVLRTVERLLAGECPGRPQPHTDEPVLPRRRPQDGLIDWSLPARQVYDFIRAITRPYPGAFSFLSGTKVLVWKAALPPDDDRAGRPGRVCGAVISFVEQACGIEVECGRGRLIVLEAEYGGDLMAGRRLAQAPWVGETFSNE